MSIKDLNMIIRYQNYKNEKIEEEREMAKMKAEAQRIAQKFK